NLIEIRADGLYAPEPPCGDKFPEVSEIYFDEVGVYSALFDFKTTSPVDLSVPFEGNPLGLVMKFDSNGMQIPLEGGIEVQNTTQLNGLGNNTLSVGDLSDPIGVVTI